MRPHPAACGRGRAPRGARPPAPIARNRRPAAIAPRHHPRKEQLIRAEAAERLGLIRMLHAPRDGRDPSVMAGVIRGLADQPPPSAAAHDGLLDGLEVISRRAFPAETSAFAPAREAR